MADMGDIAASSLQSTLQQSKVSQAQDGERNAQAANARAALERADARKDDVVGDESEMTVNSEGGGGGQGRSFTEEGLPEEQTETTQQQTDREGITQDETGRFHIDLEA